MLPRLTITNRGASEICEAALEVLNVTADDQKAGHYCDATSKSTLPIVARPGLILRLTRNEFDCPKMFDERYAGYFLHNRDGSFLNTTAQFLPQWMGCDVAFPDATYPNETTQLYLDWRNESARNWWLDVHIGSIINSTVVDGFYCENSPSLTLVYAAGGGRRADDCCLT